MSRDEATCIYSGDIVRIYIIMYKIYNITGIAVTYIILYYFVRARVCIYTLYRDDVIYTSSLYGYI